MKKQCQVNDCKNKAKYGLYKTFSDRQKVWLNVCTEHEEEIGGENIQRADSYLTQNENS